MSEQKKYFKDFVTILSGNTISQLIPFILAPILSRIFAPEEFAMLANFLALSTLFGIVAAGRMELAIPIPKSHTEAQNITVTGLVILGFITLLSLLVLPYKAQISAFYDSPSLSEYLWLVPIAVFSIGLLGITNYWVLRKGNYSVLSIGKVVQALLNNGLAAWLGYIGWGVYGLIVGWITSQFVGIFILLIASKLTFRRKNYNVITVKSTLKEYKDFPMINSLHAFSDIFATQFILYWLITSYFGLFQLGLFSMMNKYVRAPIGLITNSVSQLFYKEASSGISENKDIRPVFFRTIRTSSIFAVPFVIVLLFFGPELFAIYLGESWRVAGVYAQYFSPVLIMLFITSPVSGIPILFNMQKKAFLFALLSHSVSLVGLGFCVFLNVELHWCILVYSSIFATSSVLLLIWYYSLILNKESLPNDFEKI